ncbi:hypothetical protein SteCoe_28763 [Stentor coeruleus]|uniref:Uncharacterized protein n=1 Tax=Stentor coeruleus TaxID=5963 RepID=A0A1R2B7Z2_9CILI|nr:hypothetical protein SteCoe_28763 [Stentor coeruleus]
MKKKYKPKGKNPEIPEKKLEKLTEKNLKKLDTESKESKHKEKPKWAMTKEEVEFHEEKEVDNLLEYIQSLDYDSFIDDLEIRQALEIVKERVEEIKKDKEWKQNIASKYNIPDDKDNDYNNEIQSKNSKVSMNSFVSKARSQIEKYLEGNKKNEAEWDRSTRNDKVSITDEEKIAKLVADQVLANYPNLKSIHSNASVRKMLEKEAKNQLIGPVITTIKEDRAKLDASNPPHLHRNPAV